MRLQTHDLTGLQHQALEEAFSDHAPGPWVVVHLLTGDLDVQRLRHAIASLRERTTIFGRSYVRSAGSWAMVVGGDVTPPLDSFDLRGHPEDAAFDFIQGLRHRTMRPEGAPLARFTLLELDQGWALVFTAASWLIDRFSLAALYQALSEAYRRDPAAAGLLDLDQQELLDAQAAFLTSPAAGQARRYWLGLLRDRRTQLTPPRWIDPLSQSTWITPVAEHRLAQLAPTAEQLGMPLAELLMLGVHLFLAKMTGSQSIVTRIAQRTGDPTPTGQRRPIGYAESAGYFLSLPRRGMRLRDYLLDTARLYEHSRRHPLWGNRELTEQLRRLEPGFTAITNVSVVSDTLPHGVLQLPGVQAKLLPRVSVRTPPTDLSLAMGGGAHPTVTVTVRDPHSMPGIQQMFQALTFRLEHLAADLDTQIGELDWTSEQQRRQLLQLAQRPAATAEPATLLARIVATAQSAPDEVAVRYQDTSLTYRELVAAADALAARLRPIVAEAGPDPLVGICLPRGMDMIVALVGVMRAGAGYVPLDPSNPPERLSYILGDARAAAVVVEDSTVERVAAAGDIPRIGVPARPQWQPTLAGAVAPATEDWASTAYVIYTSGTTGLPKGVVVERGNLAAYLVATEQVCSCGPQNRWLQFASINFDASVLEIGNCLGRGATLVVAPSEVRADPEAIADLLERERITHAFIPPALLRSLPRRDLPDLTDIYVGGEASDDLTVAYWSRAVRLWNCYGPTETTVMCSAKLMGDQRSAADLGGPLPGYSMFVLDDDLQLVPSGAVGEIWIGGDAVARGYLGREQLTGQRFRPNPFGPGRLYRTGDLARHFPSGDLEYLGRNDFQVKIRGFRIELGDIEAAIAALTGVTGVYVSVIDGPSGKSLGAWYTATSHGPDPQAVAQAVSQRLPHYMVPSHLVRMDSFPVNISGKVDRTHLPMPTTDSEAPTGALTPLESSVRDVWAAVLGVPAGTLGLDSHFFHSGGHSLAAAVACHQVTERTGLTATAKLLFEHPTLAQFCAELGQDATALPTPAVQAGGTTSARIAGAMPAMMFRRAAQMGSDTAYTIAMRVDVGPEVNPVRFRRAVRELLESDAVFRSAFTEVSGQVRLTVDPDAAIDVPLVADADTAALVEQFRATAFDLGRAPLWRAEVVAGEAGTTLLFAVHHGIFDGWSLNLMLAEIAARYDALAAGTDFVRSGPTMLDYGRYLEGHDELRQHAISYWDAKLSGASCRIELPSAAGRSRPDANREVSIAIPARTVAQLKELATALDVTLPPVLFAGYLVWLWRITGQRELVVAYPYAGRDVPGADGIYGMFVQMGFLRVTIDPDEDFAALVTRVGRQMVDDREHLIASPYDVDLSDSGSPNVLFSLQSGIGLAATYGSVSFSAHEYASRSSKADIAAILYDSADGGLEGRVEYDSSALDANTVAALVQSWEWLIPRLPESAAQAVSDVPYLPPEQRERLATLTVGPGAKAGPNTIVAALRAAAGEHPQAVAITSADRSLSYAELDATTDQMANALRAQFDPARQEPIGLSGRKSPELVMGAIAILKAGCAYVPLDPQYPAERLEYILADAGVRLVVADPQAADVLRGLRRDDLACFDPYAQFDLPADTANPVEPDPRDLAYVIYTSGSTGRPKGVMIEHATVPGMIRGSADMLDFDDSCRMLLLGTLNFDASVLQVFLPLLTGGTLVIPAANAEQDPEGLHAFIDEQRVTHVVATPSLIRNLPHRPLPHLRLLGFGGEAIDAPTAGYWSEQTSFWSLYGPTETTVMCSAGPLRPGGNHRIIGRPLPGYSMTLRDNLLQRVLIGATGEIVIGGQGAARGYLGRPDLTLDRFPIDPDGADPFEVVYRSGDLGRLLEDGTIEYLGRNDDQVKLRGFRIELGEVEAALQAAPGVSQGAAMVRGEGDLRMIVGYISGPPELDLDAVRAHCASVLPEYMVPATLVRLDRLPLNANGKLDRRALPDVTFTSTSPPPREGRETQIAAVWEELLHLPGIGRDDDFFRLGGNSLLAARLQALLRERLGLDLTTAAIYASPTIAGLAGQGDDDAIAHAVRTAVSGVGLEAAVAPRVPSAEPPCVLLTGATGFLGTFLLAGLLSRSARVTCLVRGADESAARAAMAGQAERAGLELDLNQVQVLLGDLAAPDLGLTGDMLARLADQVDMIVHNGAWVHHRYSYTTMRASNVDSTAALLRLALAGGRRARFTLVSTQSAAESIAGIDHVAEDILDPVAFPPASDNGYLLTKWVAEELLAEASRRHGLDALIARPGNITGAATSGFSNYAHNHFWLFTKSCLQLGLVPTLQAEIEMTPVDLLARAIVGLALDGEAGLRVANLSNPITTSWPQWLDLVANRLGRSVLPVTPAQWQRELMAAGEGNALWPLRELYAGDIDGPPLPVDRTGTQQRLAELGLSTAADPATLAPTYLAYLQQEGFWLS